MVQPDEEAGPWTAGELRMAVRIDGQKLDPRLVIAGADQLTADRAIEVDLDKMILQHELEELDIDLGDSSLVEWISTYVNGRAPRRYGGKPLGPSARFQFLQYVRPTPQEFKWLFGLIRRPPTPLPVWSWVSTSVRDGEQIVTFVGRAVRIQ